MKKVLKKKAFHYSIFSPSGYIVLFFLYSISLIAQDNSILAKRLQRATFIYNFAEQIVWPYKGQNFSIGVLGNDRTLLDLKNLSSKRKINKMPVTVSNFNKIDEIENIQILYVNKSFNYDIDYIVNKIKGRNILLITEDYNSN